MLHASSLRLALLTLMWGSSFLWIKIALEGLSPAQVTLGRVALGAACLIVLCWVTGLRLPTGRTAWVHVLVISLFGNAIPFMLFSVGEQTVDSGLAGVLNATTPLWTAVFALLARQERRPSLSRVTGLALGFAGTVLILAPWHGAGGTLAGALACVSAAVCYGLILVYTARYVVPLGIPPVALSAAQIGSATGWMLLATPFVGLQPVHLDPMVVLSIALLGLFGTGYAFVLYNRLIAEVGPTNASTVTYLLPAVAVLLGAVALDEPLNLRVLLGMAVVLVGVMLTQRRTRAAAAAPAPESPPAVRPAATGGGKTGT